ncbi:UNVERIFIED_CONTAM: hypothetical protein PYX00_006567 [Menopon gallinae]|uniref:Jumonji domain-containing protein 4 n=1 Tax=Menopon gallinae TaxID=328185 RepID=A0AAW2HVT1_9NEOP
MDELELNRDIEEPEINYDNIEGIPRFDTADLEYSDFFENILLNNRPGILKDVTGAWKCSKYWVKNGTLNVDYFDQNYAEAKVVVSNCGKNLYNDYPGQGMYRVPGYFASDWLNEYYDLNNQLNDDFRFVYIGPKGSWTPFHADVLTSFSWSANVCGRKKWVLLPPGTEDLFRDKFGRLKYSIDSRDYGDKPQIHEIIQEKGEVIFVPSGWHHQVWNLDDAISVNHNWINGCNIIHVWDSLKSSLAEAKKEISDLEGADSWNEDCQNILGASFVFNYYKFYDFLKQIGRVRIKSLKQRKQLIVYGNWSIGENHIIFDLKRILKVLKLMLEDEDFQNLKLNEAEDSPYRFCIMLESFLRCEV